MKLLLDTHAFLWLMEAPEKLSAKALDACQNSENELWLSLANVWELQIKLQLGKLRLEADLAEILESQSPEGQLRLLPIELEHILELGALPSLHRDPFDRLLVAQARLTGAHLVSTDRLVSQYPVDVLW